MEKIISEILEEIFLVDPNLRQYQKELEQTVLKMIKNKPDTKFDENFKEELKMKLFVRAEELEQGKVEVKPPIARNIRFWQGLSLAAVVAVLALILVLPNYYGEKPIIPGLDFSFKKSPLQLLTGDLTINRTGAESFGDLGGGGQPLSEANLGKAVSSYYNPSAGAPSYAPPLGSSPQTMSAAIGRELAASGFGGGAAGTAGTVSADASMIAPRPWPPEEVTVYKYVYAGEEFDLPGPAVEVLKRIKGYGGQDFFSFLGNASLGLLDASKFSNVKVQHLALLEDKENGYVVDITPYEGLISISENWQRVMPVYEEPPRLTEGDIPSDAELIEAANRFLAQYGVDLSHYGPPEVQADWKVYVEGARISPDGSSSAQPADIWIPDAMNINYPLLLSGKAIYEQGGYGKAGFSVSVNIRTMRVTGVYGLQTLNFDASSYPAETDKDRIMKFAAWGDFWPQPVYPAEDFKVREVEVKLGTPTAQYMRYWKYTGADSEELYVPALVFPILSPESTDQPYKQNVVIPLAKEILDSVEAQNVFPPYPVPLLKEGEVQVERAE